MNYLEMLSQLGIGSAHPGGYTATLAMLDTISLQSGCSILEVGCGTGRTACLLAKKGFRVTAIDIHPTMIEKARRRSEAEQLDINFEVGDVVSLPYHDNQFDVVLAESVTNFVQAELALAEYYRVLKPGGSYYGCEVIRVAALPDDRRKELMSFLGFAQLYSEQEWKQAMQAQSFTSVQLLDTKALNHQNVQDQIDHPDEHQIIDEGIYLNTAIWQTSSQYAGLLERNKDSLASALLTGMKPDG